jgi:biopolymer transport protein ExbB
MDAQMLSDGGPIVYPLLLCSVIAVTIAVERLIMLRSSKIISDEQCKMVMHFVDTQDVRGLEGWVKEGDSPLKEMLAILLRQWNLTMDRGEASARLEEWAGQQVNDMEKGLDTLGVISSVAPMLGLMGTVLGMVVTFESIQTYGLGNADALAGGISQALLTTLAGLSVGVPALIVHRYLLRVVDTRLLKLQQLATSVLDMVAEPQMAST